MCGSSNLCPSDWTLLAGHGKPFLSRSPFSCFSQFEGRERETGFMRISCFTLLFLRILFAATCSTTQAHHSSLMFTTLPEPGPPLCSFSCRSMSDHRVAASHGQHECVLSSCPSIASTHSSVQVNCVTSTVRGD